MTGGKPRLEVLAPAGSMEALTAAVRCGADAVYLGQKNFSARKNSQNFDGEELREAVAYAHRCGVKIHQALNIVVFQQELEALKACIRTAVEAGVRRDDCPGLGGGGAGAAVCPRYAAPRLDPDGGPLPRRGETGGRARLSRVVLARELTREEIEAIVRSTSLETEIFVHGAHCMSVSGQCYLSAAPRRQERQPRPVRPALPPPLYGGGRGEGGYRRNILSLKDMDIIPRLRKSSGWGSPRSRSRGG